MAITPAQAAAKGKGWVDANNPNYGKPGFVGPDDEETAPAATPVPAPPASGPVAAPNLGPLVVNPTTGAATHDPAQAIPPPPVAAPPRVAAPVLGPLVDNGGLATHQPAVPAIGVPGPLSSDPAAGIGAPPAPVGVPGPVSTDPAAGAAANPVNTALRDALLKMLGQGDPTMNDPTIQAQSQAFGVQQERAKERARSAMAERFAANGGPGVDSGAFDTQLQGLEQAQGEAQGANDAGLLQKELEARRSQLMSAAALAGNQMDAESRLALEREIAKNSNDLERARLSQQGSQFTQTLAQSGQQWAQQFGLEGQKLAETARQFDTTTQAGRDALKQQLEMFKASQAQQGKEFDVDAELKKLGINQQGALGQGDLDLRRFLGEGNLNLGLLSALFQNQQFGQGLSANLGMFNSGQNNSFMQALLAALGQAA